MEPVCNMLKIYSKFNQIPIYIKKIVYLLTLNIFKNLLL